MLAAVEEAVEVLDHLTAEPGARVVEAEEHPGDLQLAVDTLGRPG